MQWFFQLNIVEIASLLKLRAVKYRLANFSRHQIVQLSRNDGKDREKDFYIFMNTWRDLKGGYL